MVSEKCLNDPKIKEYIAECVEKLNAVKLNNGKKITGCLKYK